MDGFVIFLIVLIGSIVLLTVWAMNVGKKRKNSFREKYPDAAKLRTECHKDGTILLNIVDENGNKPETGLYDLNKAKTKVGYLIPKGKYTLKANYSETISQMRKIKTTDYGNTDIVVVLQPSKEYVLKVDVTTKQYSFYEYVE